MLSPASRALQRLSELLDNRGRRSRTCTHASRVATEVRSAYLCNSIVFRKDYGTVPEPCHGYVGRISEILECPKPNNARLPHRFVHFRGARRARLSQAAAVFAHRSSTDSLPRARRRDSIAGTTTTSHQHAQEVQHICSMQVHARIMMDLGNETARRHCACEFRMQSNRTRADSRCAKRSRSSTRTRTSSCSRQKACIWLHIMDKLDATLHGAGGLGRGGWIGQRQERYSRTE